ncbi:MAG TPA: protein translocase subunit SecD [Gaiellaceae bacterium]|jgi:SecD/SecF fusion protein|nr:protein translocase subunit SecD [Gaiellaceae bacterium]
MTNRRSHLILMGLLLAALAGVAALAIPGSPIHKKVTLGLDLQGGLEVVLKANPPKGQKLDSSALDRSVSIMRNRVDKLGVSEPEIRKQGSDQIVIELAGVHDQNRAAEIIGKTAQLELYDLETSLVTPYSATVSGTPLETADLYGLLKKVESQAKKGDPSAYYAFGKNKKPVGPADTRAEALTLAKSAGLKKPVTVLAVPHGMIVLTCGPEEVVCPGNGGAQGGNTIGPPREGTSYYYLFKHDKTAEGIPDVKGIPQMTGSDLKLSGTRQDFDPSTNEPVVLMQFTGSGSDKFRRVTSEEYNRGRNRGTAQHFAIVLDREIRSFPQIDPTKSDLAGGISGNAEISGIASLGEAKDLALVLQTGALPVEFEQIERTDVSATLGADSLDQAKKAALIGLLVVAVFLLALYRFLGVVAVIGLGIYAAFLYAAILLFGVTLTLPGFAGLILTIGVAADANVVIFERIKEEVRAGKSVRAAIAAGYAKGFHTIIDANVVTVITAMVLFAVATAGVKGFALMLMIGTVISLITAVGATRAMLGLLSGFSWFDNPRFMGAAGQQSGRWLQIDFMRRRYLWFAISGTIVALSIGALAARGLNLGIDFKGGTQVTFKTDEPVALADVRTQAKDIGQGDAVIQGRGKSFGADRYENFQMRMKSLTQANQNKLNEDLKARFGVTNSQVKNVSASFGRQIARGAIIAIIVSLLLIVLYIAVRFDFKFALPVIVALAHDIVITVGVYALTGREVSNATVAAVLTVLGYSIYDTIIIFDRVRENIPLMRRSSMATITNVSLWETIRRSLATTLITLLPVASLLAFGGATLKDFAFALLVGIASGAYSSIFIAAPLLTILKEREPEFARRKDADVIEPGVDAAAAQLVLDQAEQAAAAEPTPDLSPVAAIENAAADAKRERRRQRRRARPHGRAR